MPCASYTEPRLAAVYDTLNPPGEDHQFYLDLADDAPRTVLDMGCGTGRLAVALARRGHEATGADPAQAMLAIARARPGGEAVHWVASDAATLSLETRFDLIIMTGHLFQVFLDDKTVLAALSNLKRHLAPGGRLAFETRNPQVREWEQWTPETRDWLDVPGIGTVEVHYDIAGVDGELVTFETHFDFGGGDRTVAASTLRFIGAKRLAELIAQAGFTGVSWYGDWDRSPAGPHSPELIVIAA